MEDTLRGNHPINVELSEDKVLILVLMEDTLRDVPMDERKDVVASLNPCCNGRYSQSKCLNDTYLTI